MHQEWLNVFSSAFHQKPNDIQLLAPLLLFLCCRRIVGWKKQTVQHTRLSWSSLQKISCLCCGCMRGKMKKTKWDLKKNPKGSLEGVISRSVLQKAFPVCARPIGAHHMMYLSSVLVPFITVTKVIMGTCTRVLYNKCSVLAYVQCCNTNAYSPHSKYEW